MGLSSRRTALTLGIGLSGLFGLLGRAFGQGPRSEAEPSPSSTPPTGSKPPGTIGTVDIDAVFKGYARAQSLGADFRGSVEARTIELSGFAARASQESERLATLPPGSAEHRKSAAIIKDLQEQLEIRRKGSEEEFARREAEMLAQLFKEIRGVVDAVARARGLAVVLRSPRKLEGGDEPARVMAVIEQAILYSDPRVELTGEVIARLNQGT